MFDEIIEQIKKADKIELNEAEWENIPDVQLGDKIEVVWKQWGEEYVDTGYCFTLPGVDFDCGDFIIHFEETQNPEGIDGGGEIYMHSKLLATNPNVKEVRAARK